MKQANLSTIYVDGMVWCRQVWPEDLQKYIKMAKIEKPNGRVTTDTRFQDIYSETEIENMTDEDKAVYLA